MEGLRISLRLYEHLNDNKSDLSPYCSTESNQKPLSKGIKSLTIFDIGNVKAFCGRQNSINSRSCRNFGTLPCVTRKT